MTLATERGNAASGPPADQIKVVPVAHPLRWAAVVITAVLVAMVFSGAIGNPRFQWTVVADYMLDPIILNGLLVTLQLTVIAMALGIGLGVVLAFMRLSHSRFLGSSQSRV